MKIHKRIQKPGTKHLYDVEVLTKDGWQERWEIDANNRDQAARIAEKEDAQVRSVNMVG